MSSEYSVVDARPDQSWDEEADVVIVGLGAAGSCAAIEAREAGADVLVLERASGGGGLTASAAGHLYMGGGTRVQKAVGIEDSVEAMFTYLMAVTPEPDEAKIRLYCEESVSHFDWLVERGVPFNDSIHREKNVVQMTDECLIESGNEAAWPFAEMAKAAPRGHKVAMEGEAGGAKLIEKLVESAEKLGARITTDAAVKTLFRDGQRIVGVSYRGFDGDRSVRARKAVILAAGQFGMNAEMVKRYCKNLSDDRIEKQGGTFDDGVGHQLGEAAGGVLDHMDGNLVTSPFYPPEQLIYGILVNKNGERFINEDSYHSKTSILCLEQPDGVAYLIADDSFFARPLFGWQELVDAWDDVASMEKDLGMPDGALQATIAAYNENAEKGEDPTCHKAAKWLKPLVKAPFAALEMTVGKANYVGFPLGGLRVTINAQVVREDGSAIPGLYAAGGCASNIAQDGLGYSSGTCIGESTFFGRRAGRHAAGS
ncbi:MAG: FAD-dependent oxidoreductase [Deltaproteobacteria bacterium]|nr:FAD-dependent oxidoreductase [Deltaproteobacteria bacterium]MBW2394891.1 FAD-dependent oxidoreductase [Deltaproteobacteria bacterium]